jgi:hypothetical protein
MAADKLATKKRDTWMLTDAGKKGIRNRRF